MPIIVYFCSRHSFNTVHTYMYCVHCAKLLSKSVNKRAEIYHKHLNGIGKLSSVTNSSLALNSRNAKRRLAMTEMTKAPSIARLLNRPVPERSRSQNRKKARKAGPRTVSLVSNSSDYTPASLFSPCLLR